MITEARAEKLDALHVGVGFDHVAAGCQNTLRMAVGVPQAGDEVVFTVGDWPRMIDALRKFGEISGHEEERFSIRPHNNAMRTMFAATVQFQQILGFVELLVAIRIAQTPEALVRHFAVHQIQRTERIEQPVRTTERLAVVAVGHLQRLDFGSFTGANRRHRHAIQPAVLVASDETTFVIHGHGHPRALLRLRHGIKQLSLEIRRQLHRSFGESEVRRCKEERC